MKKRFMKSFLAVVTSVSMLMTGITIPEMKSYASEAVIAQTSETVAASSNKYGLLDKACDGLILHCWNWSYNEIKNSMAEIAKAGYTSLQTSPVQMPKDAGSNDTQGTWWKVYQPTTLSMVDSHPWFGTKEEFKAMCDEAEKYGIKVIVDIVANHMANNTGGIGNSRGDICSQNDPTFRDDDSCWHLNGSKRIDYNNQHRNGDTSSLTWGFGGWPDLNTGSKKVQNAIVSLLKECVDLGADGFRFDAAKHIELPSDPGGASDFWPYVTSAIKKYKPDVYLYGEILDDSATAISNYTKYIAVTDNRAGNATSWGVNNHDIGAAASSSLTYNGELGDNIVLWAESHDTYANDGFTGPSTKLSQSVINRSWAIQAARDFAVLYYIRPGDTGAKMGSKSTNTAWKDSEVVEVNKFHNYFNGKSEYMSSYDGSVVLVERGSNTAQGGVVLVNIGGGSKNVTGAETHLLADGTYKDQVSGNEFKVSGGKISGNIGSTGVAVVYNKKPISLDPEATISQEGGEFTSDTLTLKLDLVNATSGTYKIGSQSVKTFTSATSITIGADMEYGESIDIVLTATDGKTTSDPVTYTFTKVEKTDNIAYIKVPSNWTGDVYCYAYDSATEKVNNGVWPGEKMILDSSTGYYKYIIPENIKAPRVIFYNSATNRYPADQEKGLLFESSGSWLYADGKWSKMAITENGTVIVKYVDESGNEIATSKKLTGKVGASYTTSAATVSGYTLKTTPSNATGKYTASTITVKYIYSKVTSSDPTVTTSLADGSTFKTETQTIKLTLSNATSGTYSVDNGPVKTFTGSANVVLGQGKVADSTVTVKATATNASGKTKSYTFTYNKKFNGTVNEETSNLSVTNETASVVTAGQNLASNIYATNPDGKKGVEKTITIDGDASDWDESMIIAKGGAWDVANHYKGGHENCVLDTTALYAAYDDENLYVAWQMVNTTDTWARSGDGPLSDGGRVLDVPLIIALSIDENSVSMSNKNTEGGPIWGKKMGLEFDTHVDRLLYMSGKPGLGKPSIFKAVDANGNTDYEDGCVGFADGGIEYKMATTNISSKIMGLNASDSTDDIFDNAADWVDYKTFKGSAGTHDITYDSFYEIKIPYSTLGITKSTITSKGIKAMLVATRGESALDCIPYDTSMLDNATGDYSSDPSTSAEKDDTDTITADFAQIGGGGVVPPSEDLELNFGADRSAPQTAGTALTLKGIAQGGSGSYTYKYYVNNKLVATKTGSGETSTSWTPQTAGTYTIKCVATDSKKNTVTSAKKYTVEGTGSITTELAAGITVDKTNVNVGDRITIKAYATGGSGSYTYLYKIKNPSTGNVVVLKDYSSATSYSFKITGSGKRELIVYVKDTTGKVVASNTVTVNIESELTGALTVNGVSSEISIGTGTTVTVKANASGGSGSYTYLYKIKNPSTGNVVVLKDYSSATSYSFKITGSGKRELIVYVKDTTGKVVASNTVTVNIESELTGALTVNGVSSEISIGTGTTATVKANASGGSGSYTYLYKIKNPSTGNMVVLKDYSSATSYSFKITGSGKREIIAYVKDSTGKVVASNTVTVNVVSELTGALTVNGVSSEISIGTGTTVTVKANASGGSGSYTYLYKIKNPSTGNVVVLKDYSSTTSYSFKITGSGKREIIAYVKDSTGKVVASNTVTVNVVSELTGALTVNGVSSEISIGTGTTVTVKANASGGSGSYTYLYKIKNPSTGNVVVLKNYSSATSYSFKITGSGKRELIVYVKDTTGKVVASNTVVINVK